MCCRELWFILAAFLVGSFAGPVSEGKTSNEPIVTDKSATIYWKSAEVSDEYFPEFALLLSRTDDLSSLSARVTEDNFLTFDDLEPNKSYVVKVYGLSSTGVNESKHHQIEFTTKSSDAVQATDVSSSPPQAAYHPPPSRVRNLEVYKVTHNEIRVKWLKPAETNGDLRRFRVFWSTKTGMSYTDQVALPCVEFGNADIYCHTFGNLKLGTDYRMTIQSRNYFTSTYSEMESVTARTKDGPAPETPTDLIFANVTAESFDLKWSYPERLKIVPFKFLVQVTETERYDKEHCCQEFPQMEIPYSRGETSFEAKVEGLNPASKYTVSVLGKRIGLSEPAIAYVQTRLPNLGLEGETFIVQVPVNNFRTIHQRNATNESLAQLYRPLISGPKMLVALTTDEVPEEKTGVKDGKLSAFIRSTFDSSFFVIMDLDKDVKPIVKLASQGAYKGQWGENTWQFNNGTACYRLAGVQVSKYGQTYGLNYYANSEAFQPKNLLSPFTYGERDLDCYIKHGHIIEIKKNDSE